MSHYYEKFVGEKITGLPQLRSKFRGKVDLKEGQLKAMGVPIKDHVKLIKKLREMGF